MESSVERHGSWKALRMELPSGPWRVWCEEAVEDSGEERYNPSFVVESPLGQRHRIRMNPPAEPLTVEDLRVRLASVMDDRDAAEEVLRRFEPKVAQGGVVVPHVYEPTR